MTTYQFTFILYQGFPDIQKYVHDTNLRIAKYLPVGQEVLITEI